MEFLAAYADADDDSEDGVGAVAESNAIEDLEKMMGRPISPSYGNRLSSVVADLEERFG